MSDKLTPHDIDKLDAATDLFSADMGTFENTVNRMRLAIQKFEAAVASFEDAVNEIPTSIELDIPKKKE